MLQLDDWQQEVLKAKGDLCICSGRQTGKSTVVSILASTFALKNRNTHTMIVSVTEDQAILLLQKCHLYIGLVANRMIKKGSKRPTKSKIELMNGSIIRTKAVGQTGTSVLGFTNHLVIVDEAHKVPDTIWEMLTPTILTTKGRIILISTPYGTRGYFYDAYHSGKWNVFHTNSEEVIKNRKITSSWTKEQRTRALEHLKSEKERMSDREYRQQYLGQFISDLGQFFPDDVIRKAMVQSRQNIERKNRDFYLGVDVARLGGDETTFEVIERKDELLIHRENIVWKRTLLSETTQKIINLDSKYDFKRIYIDDGGLGVGVFDALMTNTQTKRKTVAINNAQRVIEYRADKEPRKKKLIKEDLYNNLLHLMEKSKILLLDDSNVFQSLKSIQYEYVNEKGGAVMRIFGDNSHIVEGIIRAAWCIKDKINKVWFRSF